MNRAEKISFLKSIAAGVKPTLDNKQWFLAMLKEASTVELNTILDNSDDINKQLQQRKDITNDEFKELLAQYPENKFMIFEPAPNCEPIEDETSDFKAITAIQKTDTTIESLNNKTQQPKPTESQRETISNKPVIVPQQKKDKPEYSTFIIGGKHDKMMTEYLKTFYGEPTNT